MDEQEFATARDVSACLAQLIAQKKERLYQKWRSHRDRIATLCKKRNDLEATFTSQKGALDQRIVEERSSWALTADVLRSWEGAYKTQMEMLERRKCEDDDTAEVVSPSADLDDDRAVRGGSMTEEEEEEEEGIIVGEPNVVPPPTRPPPRRRRTSKRS